MENNSTICAVVVTYNRKNLLIECLDALKKQTRPLDGIYLIDNASTDGTPQALLENGYINELPPDNLKELWEKDFEISNPVDGKPIELYYVRMHVNTGGAGGFQEGIKRAYEKGYGWLWLMDDDAVAHHDALEKLLIPTLFDDKNVYALSNTVIKPDGAIEIIHRRLFDAKKILETPVNCKTYKNQYFEIDTASFVGLLMRSEIINRIGFPIKEFFIYFDDTEYSLRMRRDGGLIINVSNSKIIHYAAATTGRHELRRKPLSWRDYYGRRNSIYTYKKYGKSKLALYLRVLIGALKTQAGILLFRPKKISSSVLLWRSIFDGVKGRLRVYKNF